jgi:peptide-methionine (S)-S-oxide reductase
MSWFNRKSAMVDAEHALAGRDQPMPVPNKHYVKGTPLQPPFPDGLAQVVFGMGCFWGAERIFWTMPGVYTTAVGYAGGFTPNPSYEEVCSGRTGHTEVVLIVYDPSKIRFGDLLQAFWQSHDPTQGMRQGNDLGTQYRSAIYCFNEGQRTQALDSLKTYQAALNQAGYEDEITTEIRSIPVFYYAEEYHQQYLAKNPGGYCGLGGTGVSCPNLRED